jgi:ABC-2 type transport system ATP-binding protein
MIREMAQRRVTILFSTHVMQHAERLCDRILLMAKGRKVFDGTVSEAKRTLPRRVRIEAEGSIDPIRGLSEVLGVERAPGFESGGNGHGPWDFQLRDQADPQVILQACFERGIRLRSFTQTDPSLHDVFVHLVGAEAKEASFR